MAICSKWKKLNLEGQLYIIGLAVPFIAGLFYWLYIRYLQPKWPFPGCIWDFFFGFYCPGCGGTRAVEALLNGKIIESFLYHPAVLYGVVLYGIFMISHTLSLISRGRIKGIQFRSRYLYGAIFIILINFLVRNVLRIGFDIYL